MYTTTALDRRPAWIASRQGPQGARDRWQVKESVVGAGDPLTHPYIPNAAPDVRRAMLRELRISSPDELFEVVPDHLRLKRRLDLPEPLVAERDLVRHMHTVLRRNRSTVDFLSFLGAGTYPHHVPAVCDEVNGRAEFLTAYAGEAYEDHGKHQALFEYASLMAEVLEMDVVTVPTYDGFQAAATALRMAGRITGRRKVVIVGPVLRDKLDKLRDYAVPELDLVVVAPDHEGRIDSGAVTRAIGPSTAGLYLEVPGAWGLVDGAVAALIEAAHEVCAVAVVSTDPISLGVLGPPAGYGADIVCGDIQSLGLHMQFGGAHGGFLAVHDDEDFVMQLPSRLIGLAPTAVPGELGFTDLAYERTSLAAREHGVEWVGTAAALWGITAGVYLALAGPHGLREVGETILDRTHYAMAALARVDGVRVLAPAAVHFREFVIALPKPAHEVLRALRAQRIFGGYDLRMEAPQLGPALLVCVTETHTYEDIDRFAAALEEVL